MSPGRTHKRAVRVGGASAGFSDRAFAIPRMAKTAECDVIVGDWLAEMTMTEHGVIKAQRLRNPKSEGKNHLGESLQQPMYSVNFLDCFQPAIADLKKNGIKVAVNAGSCDTEILAHLVKQMCEDAGHPMKVSWVSGDDVFEKVQGLMASGERFQSLNRGRDVGLKDWEFEPLAAQAYLGGLGIAEAFRNGADIVICGRVADAAPTIGAAACVPFYQRLPSIVANDLSSWWHDWSATQFDELAGALIAGRKSTDTESGSITDAISDLIECSSYVTGANYSGFKDMLKAGTHLDIGFPIAEVDYQGEDKDTKEKNIAGGCVNVATCTSQLIYEIQGPLYYGSDVTADIENAEMSQEGENRVRVWGIKGKEWCGESKPETTLITQRGLPFTLDLLLDQDR